MAFGEKLQEVRRKNGLTQEEFAAQLNVSRQAVSKWESCRGYPEIEKLLYICNSYHVTMNELFCDEIACEVDARKENERSELRQSTLYTSLCDFLNNRSPVQNALFKASVTMLCLALAWLILYRIGRSGMEIMTYVWIGAAVVFGIAEAVTAGLVSIWFVVGAVAALIAAVLNASISVQVTAFLIVSAATLVATRPLVKRMMKKNITPTNADRLLGAAAKVTERIDNENATGAVYIDGKTWTARSESGESLEEGILVEVVKMEGVKLFVKRKGE